jgi:hypothetical protein
MTTGGRKVSSGDGWEHGKYLTRPAWWPCFGKRNASSKVVLFQPSNVPKWLPLLQSLGCVFGWGVGTSLLSQQRHDRSWAVNAKVQTEKQKVLQEKMMSITMRQKGDTKLVYHCYVRVRTCVRA